MSIMRGCSVHGKNVGLHGDKTSSGAQCIAARPGMSVMGLLKLYIGDKTTPCPKCGEVGVIVAGDHRCSNSAAVAVDGAEIRCGCPQGSNFLIAPGTIPQLSAASSRMAPVAAPESEQHAQAAKRANPPSYLTGEKTESGFVPDYPVLRNTQDFPDENLRGMLSQNNQDVMLLTIPEAFEVLQSWGWNDTKTVWVETTQSDVGQVLVNYGVNGKDVVTTSMIISKLGSFGIKATVYINHKGTELIKLTGYPGIRKVLNAPVFALKNPKVVDLGIGKYGLGKSIVEGARLTFYVAAAYRTIDFILNDETHLA